MAIKKKSAASAMDFVTCNVAFTNNGVQMTFNPPNGSNGVTQSLSQTNYNSFVRLAKELAPPAAAGNSTLPSGKLVGHQHDVSKTRKTKFAFCLNGNTTWQFVDGGFRGSTAAARRRFSRTSVSSNGKLVEVTFTPVKKKVEKYPYDLWLKAKVLTPGVSAAKSPSVTVIIDPVIRNGSLP